MHRLLLDLRATEYAQKSGKGDQKTDTADLKAKEKEARDADRAAAKVARATLDADGLTTLGLTGKEARDTAGFIQAGYTLFDNAADSGLLVDFGYDDERISAERAKIATFDTANQAQEMAKGAAQQTSQDQEAALVKMNDWVAQYLKIAKAAPAKAAATRAAKKAQGKMPPNSPVRAGGLK
jgi:hypothetical protein